MKRARKSILITLLAERRRVKWRTYVGCFATGAAEGSECKIADCSMIGLGSLVWLRSSAIGNGNGRTDQSCMGLFILLYKADLPCQYGCLQRGRPRGHKWKERHQFQAFDNL